MKNKFSLPFFSQKSLRKKTVGAEAGGTPAPQKTTAPAKVIYLFQKEIPVVQHAKVIAMFT